MPTMSIRSHPRAIIIGTAASAVLLSACTMSDESLSRLLVAPDKFVLYNCPELVEKAKALAERERELTGLMAKAGPEADGRLVSAMAYRPEYISVQGEQTELRKAAAAKNCPLPDAANAGAQTATVPR
jgi:hypothetical protein